LRIVSLFASLTPILIEAGIRGTRDGSVLREGGAEQAATGMRSAAARHDDHFMIGLSD
jgi:hypothetical protein